MGGSRDQLRAVLHLALQQPVTSYQHWAGAPTWGQFLDTCHHWHRYRDPHAAELILQTIGHQLQEAQMAAHEETTLQYRQRYKKDTKKDSKASSGV